MLSEQPAGSPIDPRALYESLPNKPEDYSYLRDVQGQVLAGWHQRRDARDLVVKVNTGGGKTIDGLVILSSYLNEGLGPALYVAPDKYLAAQVRAEAHKLGIATVDDPDDVRYLRSEAIAVINAYKLVNGRSVFAGTRAPKAPLPIGSLVLDDVHAAITTTRAQLSITIERDHAAFDELLNLFRQDLRQYSPGPLLDVDDHSPAALLRVPFWHWRARLGRVREILHQQRKTDPLRYSWPAVAEVLGLSRAVFTGTKLTITPVCPPIRHITGFTEAKRRVYLTATLADDSVLVTDFGADPNSVRTPITPSSAGDIGERMILAPLEINPDLPEVSVREAIAGLATQHNVVVLVPSDRAAQAWAPHTSRVVHADDVGGVVTDLRSGHQGLVVLVNKYDGIDLPGDACRVLVLDGLPEVATGDERLEAQILRQAGTDDRQVQRIEQGMGRGVRSSADHCVVFLLGSHLSQLIADPRSAERFSAATRAQIELSRAVAGRLDDSSLTGIISVARQALGRDPGWVTLARRSVATVSAPAGTVSNVAIARRRAFELAVDGDHRAAAQALSNATGQLSDPREKGWLLEQKAFYLDQVDPAEAQQTLASARASNPAVLRPLSGLTYQRLSTAHEQAQQAADYLRTTYITAAQLRLGIQAIADDLRFDPEHIEEFEEALGRLARHIGFGAQRPEKEMGHGPDVLWSLGELSYWVIEAKSGATSDVIHKRDANQLGGSGAWFKDRYDHTTRAVPVMVHRARRLAADARATPGMKVLTEARLTGLRDAFIAFGAGLGSSRWDVAGPVAAQLTGHHLRAADMPAYLSAPQAT